MEVADLHDFVAFQGHRSDPGPAGVLVHMLEEAARRDHRKLGKDMDLFHLQEEAPGMIFWHAKGWALWQVIEQYMRRIYRDNGYQEVKAPQLLDRSLWSLRKGELGS